MTGDNAQRMSPFSTLHHLSVVVRDIDKAVEYYESLGIGPFVDYPPLTDYVKLNVKDENGFFNLRFKCAQVGPVEIQLCQPGDGWTPYKEFLETKGEGVYHLGFVVDDVDQAEVELKEKGIGVISSGRRRDGSGYSYMDTASQAGVVLLVRQSPGGAHK